MSNGSGWPSGTGKTTNEINKKTTDPIVKKTFIVQEFGILKSLKKKKLETWKKWASGI